MASLRELGKGQGKLEAYGIDPRIITIRPGFNYRDTTSPDALKHIAFLKESIRDRGVDEPIWVENLGDGGLALIDGECRLLALNQLWDEGYEIYVPTIVYKGDEGAVLAKSLVANASLPPTVLEFGKAAERLMAYGWTVEKIATLTPPHIAATPAKARKFVQDAVELQQAPLAVKEALRDGVDGVAVSPALAVAATRKNRIMAPEIIKQEAAKAKAAGKKTANRPKGAGAATKAKAAQAETVDALLKLGDKMAAAFLTESPDWDSLEKLAKRWQKARV